MIRRPFPLVVLLGAVLAVPVLEAQSTTPPQSAPPASVEDQWPPAGVLRLTDGVRAPTLVTDRKPNYTAEAMRARIQGMVELQAIVLADGTVGEVRVVRSLDKEFGLDEEAVRALKDWVFKPGRTKDGTAVPVLINVEMTFLQRKR